MESDEALNWRCHQFTPAGVTGGYWIRNKDQRHPTERMQRWEMCVYVCVSQMLEVHKTTSSQAPHLTCIIILLGLYNCVILLHFHHDNDNEDTISLTSL